MIRSLFQPVRIVWYLLSLFLLAVVNASFGPHEFGSLQFVSPRLNLLAMIAALLLPLGCVALLLAAPGRTPGRRWAAAGLAPVALLSLLVGAAMLLFDGSTLKTDRGRFTLERSVTVAGAPVRVYRQALFLESDRLIIQQERTVFPGLIWVRILYKQDHAEGCTVQILDTHRLRCQFYVAPGEDEDGVGDPKDHSHTVTLTVP